MQLQNIMPRNGVDGFIVDSLRRSGSLVGESDYSSLLIDYYLEIGIWSDGTNQLYPKSKKIRVLISQFTDTCDLNLASKDPDAIIIVLKVHQLLVAVRLAEGVVGEECTYKPYLMFSVRDTLTNEVLTTVWDILKPETVPVK